MEAGLRTFVDRVLTLAGAEHVWLDEDAVRVTVCPALRELFQNAATVDLALSDAALQDRPAATPCVPGSFTLDWLIQRVREEPSAYRVVLESASPSQAGHPPAAANAETLLLRSQSGERGALYVLFRVSLQSDELVERLAAIVVDQRGRLRPDLVTRVQEATRVPDAAPRSLSTGLLEAVERAGEQVAQELAAEVRAAIEERKGREIQRLESYLRALRDEMDADLPAGPARRVASAQAHARALLDNLAVLLPEERQWERAAVLARLERRLFRRPFQKPPPPLPIPEALIPPLAHVIRRLPERFQRAEAEALVRADAARQLERLEQRAKGNASPAELLAERERQLEDEHRARIADIEQKYHLRIRVTPLLLEQLHYPAVRARVGFVGHPGVEAETEWNSLSGQWEPAPCPACNADPATHWLCEREHLACGCCVRICRDCARARCPACGMQPCAVCARPSCDGCGHQCAACSAWACGRHGVKCPECGKESCSRCGPACYQCEQALCAEHHARCAECQRPACVAHSLVCRQCGVSTCSEHGARCPECTQAFCGTHGQRCAHCGLMYCAACAGEGRRCATCQRLEPAGPATVDALRAWLSKTDPQVPGLGSWRLSRNTRYLVVTARRWPWAYLYVLDEEARSVVRTHRWLKLV